MNRDIIPFSLRLPADLRKQLEDEGAKNIRSLNAEIITRLESSLAAEDRDLSQYTVGELIQELIRRNEPVRLTIQIEGQKDK